MVKVTLPLQSDQAHGRVGQSIIFQGTTAKVYRAPKVRKVEQQINAEARFQSVTKTIRMLKAWGRGSLQGMLGPRWYSIIYGLLTLHWDAATQAFASFTAPYQAEWKNYAPYQGTRLDPGLTFFACAYGIQQVAFELGFDFFEVSSAGMTTAQSTRAWWDKLLVGVFMSGKYDDTNADLRYYSFGDVWATVSDIRAFNGSYRHDDGSVFRWVQFFIYGSQLGIVYHQLPMESQANVQLDNGAVWLFSENDVSELWQVEWLSPVFTYGLHRVIITRTGAEGSFNIDGIVVYG